MLREEENFFLPFTINVKNNYITQEEFCRMAESKLKQTKNSFKFIGKVTRIDKDGAFKQEEAQRGKREGDTYRSLRFAVKTSQNNEMTVSMYDFEPTEVFMWNSEKKKADSNYKGDRIPFSEWEEKQESLREEGYAVLQTRVGLTYGEDGKIQSKGIPSYVASKDIFNGLSNGDSVVIEGEIRYSMWKNQEDKMVEQKTFSIKKAFRLKDVDFDADDFEEVTYFEQEMVFVGADMDKPNKKVYVTGRVIDYAKNFHDTTMVVDFSDGQGGNDAGMVKLAEAFLKKFKFGDVLNVFGDAVNRVIVEEVKDDESVNDDDLIASLGGKKKPKHAESYTARTYVSEMQIHGIDAWDKKVYTEDDFIKDELIDEENKLQNELGGKNKKKNNPFEEEEGAPIDISDEDLPF
jgi:single-stranded DNA-binding protein